MRRFLGVAALLLMLEMSALGFSSHTYKNKEGHWVKKPHIYKRHPLSTPSAACKDGSLSFSERKQGTCSHHGGVKR